MQALWYDPRRVTTVVTFSGGEINFAHIIKGSRDNKGWLAG